MWVETLRTVLVFPRQSIWGVTCLGLLKKWMFSHLSPEKPINVCWNPRNSACFSKTIDLRGHMPRFTQKMDVFPSISIETPKMCVETLRTVLISPGWSIWGVICLGLVEKCMFSQLCPFFFSETIDVTGHMPRFTLKINIFPSISWETP